MQAIKTTELQRLLAVIGKVTSGDYSDEIMDLTRESVSEPVRMIAEAMGLMMVKVEAREFRLEQLVDQLGRLNEQIRQNTVQTVAAMAQALEARDSYTRGHAERVSQIAVKIAEEMGLEKQQIELVRTAGLMHDIGKIGCSDRIFQNHGPKNPPDVVKEILAHPLVGEEILSRLEFLNPVTAIIVAHHERMDGKGYPRRITGNDIPLEARIIAVADGFDAMTTDRPYQKAKTVQTALAILEDGAGTHWDSEVVAAFRRSIRKTDKTPENAS